MEENYDSHDPEIQTDLMHYHRDTSNLLPISKSMQDEKEALINIKHRKLYTIVRKVRKHGLIIITSLLDHLSKICWKHM